MKDGGGAWAKERGRGGGEYLVHQVGVSARSGVARHHQPERVAEESPSKSSPGAKNGGPRCQQRDDMARGDEGGRGWTACNDRVEQMSHECTEWKGH